MLRKLARSIARAEMKRAKVTQINKARSNGKSLFATYWRDWLRKGLKRMTGKKIKKTKKNKRRSA